MSSILGPMTQDILNKCIDEFKKNKKISKHIVDPLITEAKHRLYRYYLIFIVLQILIVCLLVYIAYKVRLIKKN